ncbi:hypothetical protein AAFX24_14580 [Vibrio mediterranei]|uniref:hypothetical protein n=1 Tax=Vibrio mediterranei TaxID=689 RepID=UPI0038CE8C56
MKANPYSDMVFSSFGVKSVVRTENYNQGTFEHNSRKSVGRLTDDNNERKRFETEVYGHWDYDSDYIIAV